MKQHFILVRNNQSSLTPFKHHTIAAAITEAERLLQKYGGTVAVYALMSEAIAQPHWEHVSSEQSPIARTPAQGAERWECPNCYHVQAVVGTISDTHRCVNCNHYLIGVTDYLYTGSTVRMVEWECPSCYVRSMARSSEQLATCGCGFSAVSIAPYVQYPNRADLPDTF